MLESDVWLLPGLAVKTVLNCLKPPLDGLATQSPIQNVCVLLLPLLHICRKSCGSLHLSCSFSITVIIALDKC